MTLENSPSKVAAADQPLTHFISAEAVVSAESLRLRRAVDDKACARQRLEGRRDRTVRIEIMRPGEAAAQRQHAVGHGEGFVGADAEFAARVGDALGGIGQRESAAPDSTLSA